MGLQVFPVSFTCLQCEYLILLLNNQSHIYIVVVTISMVILFEQSLPVAFGAETAKWICVGAIDITQLSVAGI